MVHVDLFQTLADPTRRLIVEALQGSEQSVNDIVARVAFTNPGFRDICASFMTRASYGSGQKG